MYRSLILTLITVVACSAFAQNKMSIPEAEQALKKLNAEVRGNIPAEKKVELIAAARKQIEARIDEVAIDDSVPYEIVSQYYRLGDQLIILGMLRAQGGKLTAESCLRAKSQVSAEGIDVTNDKNVTPKHLKDVARTLSVICK